MLHGSVSCNGVLSIIYKAVGYKILPSDPKYRDIKEAWLQQNEDWFLELLVSPTSQINNEQFRPSDILDSDILYGVSQIMVGDEIKFRYKTNCQIYVNDRHLFVEYVTHTHVCGLLGFWDFNFGAQDEEYRMFNKNKIENLLKI